MLVAKARRPCCCLHFILNHFILKDKEFKCYSPVQYLSLTVDIKPTLGNMLGERVHMPDSIQREGMKMLRSDVGDM